MTRLISFPMYRSIEEFTIPESVLSIDDYSFGANKYICKLIFNDNIEELPENFVYGTNYGGKITYLKLSNKIKKIPSRSLSLALLEIILPKDLEELEVLPSSLTDVTIYNSNIANFPAYYQSYPYIFASLNNLKNLHVLDTNPVELNEAVFSDGKYFSVNLLVPKGKKDIYQSLNGWKNFFNIIEEDDTPSQNQKCAKPTIKYTNGQVIFDCETEGVTFVSQVTSSDIKNYYSKVIPLSAKYIISVYATKSGYEDSDVETMEINVRGLKGDVNEDGEINIADINSTIDIILSN